MSKVIAPDVEPDQTEKKPVQRPRGKYIDFAPRRKKKPVVVRKTTVVVAPVIEETPVEELTVGDVIADVPPVVEEEEPVAEPEDEFAGLEEAFLGSNEEYDDGPMAEFNNFDDGQNEDAQEDFLTERDPEEYVEEVLSKVSETRTETTVRRSPFLKNFHVEKRPLSSRVPAHKNVPSVEALEPTPRKEFKEEEVVRRVGPAPRDIEEPIKTKEDKAGSKLGMAITVVVTVLLGAGVGVFVYLAFFK